MTTDPSTGTLYDLYHSGAYLCLGILAVYFALKYLSTSDGKIGTWLKVPGRAHYVTAAIGVIGLFVGPLSQGTTPNAMMFFTSLPAIFALLLPGAPKKADTASSQAGFAKLGLLLALACMGSCVWGFGCAWFTTAASKESKAVAGDVVDCTKSEVTKNAITEFGPAIDALLVYATGGGGQLDAAQLGAGAKNFVKGVGGCVVADAIARALKPAPADPSAPKASPLVAEPGSLRNAMATLYPGVKFHTANGDL